MFANDAWVQVEEMNMDMDVTMEEDEEDGSDDGSDVVVAEDHGLLDPLRVQGRAMTTRAGYARAMREAAT